MNSMRFKYTAKTKQGKDEEGTIEAKDKFSLAKSLRERGLVLVSAKEGGEKGKLRSPFSLFSRVSLVDKMFFTRNLKVMVSAGLPFSKALGTLAVQTQNRKMKNALLNIKDSIDKGKSFSDSLADHKDIFDELFQNMIKVGEEGGTIEEVLKILTKQMEKEHDLKSKITNALIYPAVIILAMLGIGVMMLIVVVPKLADTFKELNIQLPLATRLVIGLGTFLATYWYLIPVILFSLFLLFRFLLKTKGGKKVIDAFTLKIPVVSKIVKSSNSAYMARTLSSLLASGVSLVKSLEIVSGTLSNSYFREAIVQSVEKVKKGEKLSQALSLFTKFYPLIVIQMLEVGEETGQTSEILSKTASFFEDEVTNTTKNLASVIEPVLMIIIGGVIGFFAVSMIQPMYSMLGAIQ